MLHSIKVLPPLESSPETSSFSSSFASGWVCPTVVAELSGTDDCVGVSVGGVGYAWEPSYTWDSELAWEAEIAWDSALVLS